RQAKALLPLQPDLDNLTSIRHGKILDRLSPKTAPHHPHVAFQYAHTLTKTCLEEMKRDGVTCAIAFSQYIR
ncbi:ferrochelatase, partial [Puccinia sorghi]